MNKPILFVSLLYKSPKKLKYIYKIMIIFYFFYIFLHKIKDKYSFLVFSNFELNIFQTSFLNVVFKTN